MHQNTPFSYYSHCNSGQRVRGARCLASDPSHRFELFSRYLGAHEADAGFQGRHCDKQTIRFKREGDGYLANMSADEDGYAYTCIFHWRYDEATMRAFESVPCDKWQNQAHRMRDMQLPQAR